MQQKTNTADALETKLGAKFVKPAEISADALETTLESKFAKKGEVGTDETAVKRLIVSDLKERGIVSNDDNPKLQVATKDEISADVLANTLKEKFAAKGEVGTDETAVKRLIVSDLKERGIVSNDDNPKLQVATKDEKFAAKGEVGTDESAVNNLISAKLKAKGILSNDNNEELQLAKKTDLSDYAKSSDLDGFLTDSDLTAAKLAGKLGSTYVKDSDLTATTLSAKLGSTYAKPSDLTGFAKSTDITAEALGTTLKDTFAAKGEVAQIDDEVITNAIGNSNVIQNAVDSALEGNTTFAKKTDLSDYAKSSDLNGFLTDDDLTAAKLAGKLGSTYVKDSDNIVRKIRYNLC